jgi:PAS domain-containing protein
MLATASARAEGWYAQPGRRAEFREQLLAQGSLRDFVSEMRRPNGETFWISENAHVVRDAQGNVLYHEGTIEDITARVLAERSAAGASELLRERTDALQITLDNAGRGIARMDAGGVVVLYNRRFLELLELPESLLAARPTMAEVIQLPGTARRFWRATWSFSMWSRWPAWTAARWTRRARSPAAATCAAPTAAW